MCQILNFFFKLYFPSILLLIFSAINTHILPFIRVKFEKLNERTFLLSHRFICSSIIPQSRAYNSLFIFLYIYVYVRYIRVRISTDYGFTSNNREGNCITFFIIQIKRCGLMVNIVVTWRLTKHCHHAIYLIYRLPHMYYVCVSVYTFCPHSYMKTEDDGQNTNNHKEKKKVDKGVPGLYPTYINQ